MHLNKIISNPKRVATGCHLYDVSKKLEENFNVAYVLSYRGLVYIVCVVVSDIIQIMDI